MRLWWHRCETVSIWDSLTLVPQLASSPALHTYCSNLAWDNLITLQVQVDKENSMEFLLFLSVSQLLSWNKANCSLSAFDKEDSIEFPLDLLHYIYNLLLWLCTWSLMVSMLLINWLLGHMLWLWLVTPCDVTTLWLLSHLFVALWLVMRYLPMLHLSNKRKEKKKKY